MNKKLIERIITVAYNAKEGHIPSSLSILDILYVLYSNIIKDNDKLVLSKGHASLGLYTVLEHFNLLEENLDDFCKFESKLGGHPTNKIKNITASTGSLGHGLPIAVGMALGEKINGTNNKIYAIIGDGESNEGTIWESLLLASHHKLDNLVCILDYNHSNDRALLFDNIKTKINSFNWLCVEINGHNHEEILLALRTNPINQPLFILANTIKGHGISIMENNHEWHHKIPNKDETYDMIYNLLAPDFTNNSFPDLGQSYDESYNLFSCILKSNFIKGEIAEVGVYGGGSASIIKKYKSKNKRLYLFDTFEGLKDVKDIDGNYLKNNFFAFDYEIVCNLFSKDKEITIVKGYFPESATDEVINTKFSLVHIDVDTYESTLNSLKFFYPRLTEGGIIVVHDVFKNDQVMGVNVAISDFLSDKEEKIIDVNTSQGILIKK